LVGGPAQAGRDVALSLVGRGKGLLLLLRGVEAEYIHQAEGEVGVGGEGRKTEDCPNHSFCGSLMVPFTVNVDNTEARRVVVGRSGGLFGGGQFGFFGATPQLLKANAQVETMTRVGGVQSFLDELLHVGWVRATVSAKNPSSS